MGPSIGQGSPSKSLNLEQGWPLDARMALFLLESEGDPAEDVRARELDRVDCRVRARLMRVLDGRPQPVEVFVRDLSVANLGFISSRPLEIGTEYELDFTPGGTPVHGTCVIGRCRRFTDGWHEGVAHLNGQTAYVTVEPRLRLAV